MTDFDDFRKQTIRKTLEHSVKCGVCGEWLLKTGINRHLKVRHYKDYLKIIDNYYKMIEEYKND